MSKRRRGFNSETVVRRVRSDEVRTVTTEAGEKELLEKLGRRDPCPCGSGRSFQAVLPAQRPL